MTPGNPAYNIPVAYRLCGALDVRALEGSFNEIIKRHEAWRTTFREFEGDAVQEIHPECRIQIGIIALDYLPVGEREAEASALASQEAVKPFDLRRLPLIRVSLFRLDPNNHVLLVNLHHIIGDGLSLNLMFDELDAIYRAAISGTTPRLPALMVQYADFAVWQREDLSKNRHSGQLDYWQRQLKGDLPLLEFATDKPRPLRQSFNGSSANFSIPKSLVQALTAIGTQESCTFFVTILAAFQVILLRYSKAEAILIGTPVADRPLPEIDRLIGNFINIVALRCDLSGNPAFVELLRRSRETTLNALSNKDIPFETVVKGLKSHRDPSRNPVFQVLLQILPAVHAKIGELSVSTFDFELRFTQVDITLNLYEAPDGGFLGRFQYCTDLFAAKTMERLSLNFVQLLNEVVRNPLQKIARLPLLSPGERQKILAWSCNERDLPAKTVAQVFEDQAARTPDAIAVIDGESRLTYRELAERAAQMASGLRARGVVEGQFVGIKAERSARFVAGLLGILKAGAAYVPLNPNEPTERLEKTRRDCQLVLDLDGDSPPVGGGSVGIATAPTGPAYVLYTSGSTGEPKGVVIPHSGIIRLVIGNDYAPFAESDVVAFASNLCFDAATFEIWGALLNGGTLVTTPLDVLLDPARLAAHLEANHITTLFLTTALFNQLAHQAPAMFRGLRTLVFGGEAADAASVRRVLDHGRPQRLVNGYGPTETTTFAVCHTIEDVDGASIPIGKPIARTAVYLLDDALDLVPIGVPGEIYIGGPGVALGYLNAPELTAERFVETPFGRLYKSGDLVRWRADGLIEYLGRADQQIKLRGFRIEPGEIETALQQHPGVRQAAVVVRETGQDRALVAYLVPGVASAPGDAEMREFLEQHLPGPMVPAAFVWLLALPLTPNGKLDPGALPSPTAENDRAPADGAVAPRNPLETDLARLWAELLGRNSLSIHDDFFAIGGHSLLAIQLLGRLRGKFGVDVPVRRLFDTPTIAGVAQFIAAHLPTPPEPRPPQSLIGLQRGHPGQRPFFLVPGGWGAEIEFLVYAQLKLHLGPDLPIFGLKARGSAGVEKPHRSVREMVVDYVEEIRTVQPRGPYLLGGECIGGVLAYEMARRLEELGEKVDLLVLLDTARPNQAALRQFRAEERATEWNKFWQIQILQPFHDHMENLARLPLAGKARYIWHRATRKRGPSAEPTPLDRRKVLGHYPRLLMAHPIGTYRGQVTLLIDETSHRALGNLGWDEVPTGGLETHVLPGDHLSYIREHAATAAAKLREIIDRSNHSTP